jgi:formylglycine-generating enzyme required for sulfatase activity
MNAGMRRLIRDPLLLAIAASMPVWLMAEHANRPRAPQACGIAPAAPDPAHPTAGMIHLPGGIFEMGAAPARQDEGPPRAVPVAPFWIDRTDVTNAQFAHFVAETGYKTLAERGLGEKHYPGLRPQDRVPASLVFVGAAPGVDLHDPGAWWRIVPGADWRHPQGPGSSIAGQDALPVVHVAYEDALAYARWARRDLPTEAEWEYAARGGLAGAAFVWGDAPRPGGKIMANTWQGHFPDQDLAEDGYRARPSPVGCFPPNGFGLSDMAGNVWQWTQDIVPDDTGRPGHIIKGGSFLCSEHYCFRYRPAARTVGPPDSGASHIGFRTVLRGGAWPDAVGD